MSDHIDNSTNENPNYLKIPKIFHQIWFDFGNGNKIPTNFERNTKRLLELHPGWEIKLWSEEQVEKLIIDNVPEFLDVWQGYDKKIKKHDSSRVIILHTHGGVYLDHDFIPIKNIERLLCNNTFVISTEDKNCMRIGNAFIGSIPKHPILREMINEMNQEVNAKKDVLMSTGPMIWTWTIQKFLVNNNQAGKGFTIYSPKYLYPLSHNRGSDFSNYKFETIDLIKDEFPDCYLFQQFASTWWPNNLPSI